MAHSLSSKKRVRQNETRAERNKARKSLIKTLSRQFTDALKAQDLDKANSTFRQLTKRLDQYASTSTLHKNTAARKKSRMAKRLAAVAQKA